ncbi:N-acetylmuramoyl-L-alanine amidase [Alysiella crassa]|uniref:N-acetylmuramoyl-L-alanine amidase AmiC n=1 Tax=Alysiella crassa TaxID=153491 RepID=A0A376BV38_9NEIS|nr:N-acetylmuramoyl-L-alanine amidase [Alysiella crassa]SSY80872.1 N-acetylmuramoyl-L-alanine amidase AmiC precursor [Alysiella crassa]
MAKLSRRQLLGAGAVALTVPSLAYAAASKNQFLAVRIWPAQAYTRITLESSDKINYKHFVLSNPSRVVIDIENANLNSVLSSIPQKVQHSDPYIRSIRAGQKDDKTIRMVLELKAAINPQIFNLAPVSTFKHRMVIDLYPVNGSGGEDPILALLNGLEQPRNESPYRQTAAPVRQNRRPVVMLDPGHGGEDPGAISPNGLKEKDVVLSIAHETKKRLEAMGYKVYMTRNEDVFIPLKVRRQKAQRVQADLFVSIHADSVDRPEPRGTGVYILSERGASSEAARLLADSQNSSDSIGGVKMNNSKEVNNVLMDMLQTQTISDSARLARLILNQLSKHNKIKNEVNQANFVVLRSPEIPSILVETAFLSNPQDEALLRSRDFRKKVAQSIADGMKQYLNAAVLARR